MSADGLKDQEHVWILELSGDPQGAFYLPEPTCLCLASPCPVSASNEKLALFGEPFWISHKSKRNLASTNLKIGRQENQTARLA
jgi:hypothetical protein